MQNRLWSSSPVTILASLPSARHTPPTMSICHSSMALGRSHRYSLTITAKIERLEKAAPARMLLYRRITDHAVIEAVIDLFTSIGRWALSLDPNGRRC